MEANLEFGKIVIIKWLRVIKKKSK
jgi:hypothetical protein